jgi:hypothetical protein
MNEFNRKEFNQNDELNEMINESEKCFDVNVDDFNDESQLNDESDKNDELKSRVLPSDSGALDEDDLNKYEDENVVVDNDNSKVLWHYRNGYAYNETQYEYELLRFYLELGRGRSRVYLSRIFNVTVAYINKISEKNNWYERIEAYDRQTLSNALSKETDTRRQIHEQKLEIYRQQQETIANQASGNAAKILHLIQRKLDKLMLDTENLSIGELVSTGKLAVKFSQLQKELGSQALAVDALLEAIEGEDS